jgi:hypothetical protein
LKEALMRFARLLCSVFFIAAVLAVSGCATLQQTMGSVFPADSTRGGALDESTVVAGIKEALKVGTENAVMSTSKIDGFLGNQLIRIALPEQMTTMASTLRKVGFGSQVDELEVGMNRAAELAAGEAKQVFWNAIKGMTVSDAFGILNGGNTAATEYFREKTSASLRARFRPIVEQKIQEVGLSRIYSKVADTYNGLPLAGNQKMVDLDEYVTDKTLSGLFTVLGTEEQKIRQDPLARTTDLLRKVFGRQ